MIRAKLRAKYQGLSRQELLDKAHKLGVQCLQNSGSCSQCTVATLHELLSFEDVVVRIVTSSNGGQAEQAMGTCGALIGGTIVIDYFFGRPVESVSFQGRVKGPEESVEVAKLLYDRYIKEYGTIICPHICVQLFGRHYYWQDSGDMEEFVRAGGRDVDKCPGVVGKAARWVMEILMDKGALKV